MSRGGLCSTQSPIFLGGQGGLVGPCRLAYGTVIAAGTICRKDQLREDQLIMDSGPRTARIPYKAGGYQNIERILNQNIMYIGQLFALNQWYRQVRSRFVGPGFAPQLLEGLNVTLEKGIDERIKQLEKLGTKLKGYAKKMSRPRPRFFKTLEQIEANRETLFAFGGSLRVRGQRRFFGRH